MDKILELKNRLAMTKRSLSDALISVSNAQRKADLIAAEIKGLEAALEIVEPSTKKTRLEDHNAVVINSSARKRGLRENWKRIFNEMAARYPDGANYTQIMPLVEADGSSMTGPALRTQMMLFTQQGIVERIDAGIFKVTDAGKAASVSKIGSPPAAAGENLSLLGD